MGAGLGWAGGVDGWDGWIGMRERKTEYIYIWEGRELGYEKEMELNHVGGIKDDKKKRRKEEYDKAVYSLTLRYIPQYIYLLLPMVFIYILL